MRREKKRREVAHNFFPFFVHQKPYPGFATARPRRFLKQLPKLEQACRSANSCGFGMKEPLRLACC